jgi:hypothetical protein
MVDPIALLTSNHYIYIMIPVNTVGFRDHSPDR